MFPSELTAEERLVCAPGLTEIEEQLRNGQMHDALQQLRVHLHMKTRLVTFKDRNVRNQVANTRARGRIDANDQKIKTYASKYRRGRDAMYALIGPGRWERKYRILADSDIRTLQGDRYEANRIPEAGGVISNLLTMESEGRRRTSWIWMAADVPEAEDGNIDDNMQHSTFIASPLTVLTKALCSIAR